MPNEKNATNNPVSALVVTDLSAKSFADRWFAPAMYLFGAGIPLLLLFLYLFTLIKESWLAITTFGLRLFTQTSWDPVQDHYGAFTFVYGTLVTSFIAILISLPLGIMVAAFVYEYVPRNLRVTVRNSLDLLAGIPSVIYGLWGIFVLIPFLQQRVYPALGVVFPPVRSAIGNSIFSASIVLSIMIMPILVSIIVEGFETVPQSLREAMYGLGATRWEVTKHVVVGTTKPTIAAATLLALGRALGETMAVTMVIGNSNNPPSSFFAIFEPGQTISSLLANEFSEASGALYLSTLFELALVLLVLTSIVNILGILIVKRLQRSYGGQ